MTKSNIIKIILLTALTASSVSLINSAYAEEIPSSKTQQQATQALNQQVDYAIANSISQSFQSLTKEIKTLFQAGFQFVYEQDYQKDPNIAQIQQANTQKANSAASKNMQAQAKTTLTSSLSQLNAKPQDMLIPIDSNSTEKYANYQKQNGLTPLSGIENYNPKTAQQSPYAGSDSLYTSDLNIIGIGAEKQGLVLYAKKPKNPSNGMLNFSALISPSAYNATSQINAQNFVKYAAQNTVSWFNMSNPSTIHGLFDTQFNLGPIFSLSGSKQVKALLQLKKNAAYQRFKFNLRTLIAQRSVSVDILNHLVSERTPANLMYTKSDGTVVKNASPLQVDAYTANHRIQDPNWYQNVQNASPASVQRKTLIVLAEIEHQNYEAHLDRERIMAALATLNLNFQQQALAGYIMRQQQPINKLIQSIGQKIKNEKG